MKTGRSYSMELRAAAAEATRERILEAAAELFLEAWYDDVTIAKIAERAGVSGQTVINHFGGKEQLAAATHERVGEQITSLPLHARAGRRAGARGDARRRLRDHRRRGHPPARAGGEGARRSGRCSPAAARATASGCATMFLAPELASELVVATDVYTWKLLRRDQGLSRDETAAAMLRIVEALLERRTR